MEKDCTTLIPGYVPLCSVHEPGVIRIRPAQREDARTICANNRATARETEGRILDHHIAWKGVLTLFDNPSLGFYLVAARGTQIIGQCMITYEWSDWRCGNFWWIQSVYIIPEFRREGIFSEIFREISRRAQKEPGVIGLRLYVDRDNTIAMRAYDTLGMNQTRYLLFEQEFGDSG